MAKKLMKLTNFQKEYDIDRDTAIRWVHSRNFPAYKLERCWYVDIPKFEKWLEVMHANSYRWN